MLDRFQDEDNLPRMETQEQAWAIDQIRLRAELCCRDFSFFVREFWHTIIPDPLIWNWHLDVLCWELQHVAERVFRRLPKLYDLLFNVPPGTSKSTIATIMFPAWCWARDASLRFITGSYDAALALEHADFSRDIIRSPRYQAYFPHVMLRSSKDAKGCYANCLRGIRYTTSVGGKGITGKHGHILIMDDPLNPKQAASDLELQTARDYMGRTFSSRKVDKSITPTILIMQRLSEKDPSQDMLDKAATDGKAVRHICLPGEIYDGSANVKPSCLALYYQNGELDSFRMGKAVLKEMMVDLGQYGYAGQVLQRPTPPKGGMFKTSKIEIVEPAPATEMEHLVIRYWDKAATDAKDNPGSCFTAGVKMGKLKDGRYAVMDVCRGQWATEEREDQIKQTTKLDQMEADRVRPQKQYMVWLEQEPGSGGKDSALSSVKNLAGHTVQLERPTGEKTIRADPFSVQVNWGQVVLFKGAWNRDFLDELVAFPFGKRKDQVDAAAGAFNKLHADEKVAGVWGRKK